MAKLTPRRKGAPESTDEMLTLAQRLLEPVKPYAYYAAVALTVVAVVLVIWSINSWIKSNREAKAAAAYALVTPKADLNAPNLDAAAALGEFIKEYPGTQATRQARLLRANLLYGLGRYAEAAQAYKSLLDRSDPDWDYLVSESLSYCYEGQGNFKQAAEVLKPLAEQVSGPWKVQIMQHLALIYARAGEPKEAAVYWRKLLAQSPDPALVSYFHDRLAAAEAQVKK
jgi:predicted negative regulator of RcsB-dependent stress response